MNRKLIPCSAKGLVSFILMSASTVGSAVDYRHAPETNTGSLLESFELRGRVMDATPDISEEALDGLEHTYSEQREEHERLKNLTEEERKEYEEKCIREYEALSTEEERLKYQARITGFDMLMSLFDPRPASGAAVTLREAGAAQAASTDAQGRFRFVGVPEGEYELFAEAPARAPLTGQAWGGGEVPFCSGWLGRAGGED